MTHLRSLTKIGLFLGGVLLYLVATLLCLALTWVLPGQGLTALAWRLLLGCLVPASIAVFSQRALRRHGHGLVASALLCGMIFIGIACAGGALGLAIGFQLI